MDNNTLLVVLGDHGMTKTGDHGGDSKEEVEAALFVYSPSLHLPPPAAITLPVAQVDLVPTLALVLGVPVPFSNLGKVMEDVLVTAGMSSEEADRQRNLGLYFNVQQVKRYLRVYMEMGNSFPQDLWHKLELLEGKTSTESTRSAQKVAFSEYLTLAKLMCEEIWARFDVLEMMSGLLLMFSVLVMAGLFIYCNVLTDIKIHLIKKLLILTVIVNLLLFALCQYSGFVFFGYAASVLILLWMYAYRKNFTKLKLDFKVIDYISLSLISMLLFGSFSNSYVVMESYGVDFILLSCITLYILLLISIMGVKKGSTLSGKVLKLFGNVFSVICVVGWLVGVVCVRCSVWFWRCREEQYWCIPSQVQVPLSGLPHHLHNWRYFTSVLSLALVVWLPRRWLLLCGNLNGTRLGVLLVRTVPIMCSLLVGVWWAIQAVMAAHNLTISGHLIPPRVIYGAAMVYVVVLSCVPLLIYELPPSNRKNRQLVSDNPSVVIPQLCQRLMEKQSSEGPNIPVVYGLATAISAPLVAILMMVVVVVVLVAGDGLSGAVLLLLLTVSASLLLQALWKLKTCHNLSKYSFYLL